MQTSTKRRITTNSEPEIKLPLAAAIEESVLGRLFLSAKDDAIGRAIELGLKPDHFFVPSNKTIYGAMLDVHLNGVEVDPVIIIDKLRVHHKLEQVGGQAYIAQLIDAGAPSLTMLGSVIDQLKVVAFKRQTLKTASRLTSMAGNGASLSDLQEVIDSFESANVTPSAYAMTPTGLIHRKPGRGFGFDPERLTNFNAKIVAEQIEDDGSLEEQRIFEIEAELDGRKQSIRVPASKFGAMAWPTAMIGARAIVYPSQADKARAAIQSLSTNVRQMTVFTHTGWRQIDDVWSYLHSGGAITPTGNRTDISVRLSESLRFFHLPDVAEDQRGVALNAALSLMNAFPRTVTVPMIGAALASILGGIDYSAYVTGQSGTRKSELTALIQSFFGCGFSRLALPASYNDSALAILLKAFRTKDAVCVVDDFAPNGQKHHDDKLHTTAETIFRAAGNAAGRSTAKVDHSERGAKPPRGMLISSGEDVPRGLSLQNRLLIVPLKVGDLPDEPLTEMQAMARAGKFAESMPVFIQHVATYKKTISRIFQSDCIRYRLLIATTNKQHSRQPTTIAHLCASWRAWLRCGVVVGAFTRADARLLWKKIWAALNASLNEQKEQHTTVHPADYFLELLRSALLSGRCHLAALDGSRPENSSMLGWRHDLAMGDTAGWIDGELVYLEPSTAYKAANSQGASVGEALSVGPISLWKRMDEKNMILKKEDGRGQRCRLPGTGVPVVLIGKSAIFG